MKITLCMIVKDEENQLAKCLESAKDYLDEIVIVDTGSRDRSIEIAGLYTKNIFEFDWCDDFSAARNYSLSKATNDIVLVLDADEVITDINMESVIKEFSKNIDIVGRIKRINPFEDENGIKKYIERVNRIFSKSKYRYEGIVHEQVVRIDNSNYETANVDIELDHIGYMDEVILNTDKINRNIDLLNKALAKNPNDPYIYYQLGKSYFKIKEYTNAKKNLEMCIKNEDNLDYEYMLDSIETYGYSLIKSENYDEALKLIDYKKRYRNIASFNFMLSLIYMNNGMFDEAISSFKYCKNLKTESIEGITSYLSNYNIGVIYEMLDEKEKAIKYYKLSSGYLMSDERLKFLKVMEDYTDISLCMIVKDEEKYIENCISSVIDLVSEIVLIDTGSTDKTIEIAKGMNSSKIKIYNEKWEKDFSKARNASISKSTCKWILMLDADEVFNYNKEYLLNLISNSEKDAYIIPINNYIDDGQVAKTELMIRLFKREGASFKGRVHEQFYMDEEICTNYEVIEEETCYINHYGYKSSVILEKEKENRNIELIEEEMKDDPKNGFNYYNLGSTYMSKGDYVKAIKEFEKAIQLTSKSVVYYKIIIEYMMKIYFLQNDFKNLRKILKKFKGSKLFVNDPIYYYYVGKHKTYLEDYIGAVDAYKICQEFTNENKNYITHGINTFIPKIEIARIYKLENKISDSVNMYMEAIFHPQNTRMLALDEFVNLLRVQNMNDVLDGLKLILKEKLDIDFKDFETNSQIEEESNLLVAEIINEGEIIDIDSIKMKARRKIDEGDFSKAEDYIDKIYKYKDEDPEIYSLMGIIHMIKGNLSFANKVFSEGCSVFVDNVDLLYNLAFLYEQNGNNIDALKYYKKILEIDSNDLEVIEKISKLRS